MADITVPESAVASDKSKNAKKNAAPPEPESTLKFRLNEFRSVESPGNVLDKRKREVRGELESQWVTMKERTVNQYKTYLANYMKNLQEFSEGLGRNILDRPGHEHEKLLLQLLGDEDPAERERKIAAFLESPEGWMLTTMVIEHQAALKLYALGLYAATEEINPEPSVPEKEKIYTGHGIGKGREIWIDKIRPQLKKAALGGATVVAGGGIGILTSLRTGNLDWGASSAAAIIGTTAGMKGLIDAMRKGEVIDLKQSKDALLTMKGDPNTVLYMRKMYGIDLDDFEVTHGKIKLRSGILSSTRIDGLKKEAIQALYTRWNFYENLGIPRKDIDLLPEQFIFKYAQGETPEQTDVRMQQRLREIVDPHSMNPRNVQENLRRLNRARSQVMTEVIKDYIKRQEAAPDYARPIASLRSKKATYEGSAIKEQLTQAEREEIADLEKEKEEIRAERERFQSVDQKRQQLKEIEENLRELGLALPDSPFIHEVNTAVDAEVDRLENELINPNTTPPSGLKVQLEKLLGEKSQYIADTADREISAHIASLGGRGNIPRETLNDIFRRAEERAAELFEKRINRIQAEINDIEKTIKDLTEEKEKYRTKRQELTREERMVVVYAPKELNEIYAAYNFIINPPAGGATISEADLASLSRDELVARLIDPAGPYHMAYGTDAEKAAVHELIFRAKAVRKGEETEWDYPSHPNQIRAFAEITAGPLRANDLLTKSDTELRAILRTDAAYDAWRGRIRRGGRTIEEELAMAKAEAIRKMIIFYEAKLDAQIEDIDRRIEALNEKIESVDGFEQEKAIINTALDLLERQSVLFTAIKEIGDLDKSDKYFDLSRVRVDDPTYTQSERNLTVGGQQIEKGYYAIMDLLFDYQQRPDREEYFKIISSVLPPDKLAQLLNEGLNLRRRNPTLRSVLTEISARINSGRLDWRDLRQGVILITDRLTHEALSLP